MSDVVVRDPVEGKGAKVNTNGHLLVHAITVPLQAFLGTAFGDTYNFNTMTPAGATKNLTTANESFIGYLKNGEPDDIIVDLIVFMPGVSANATDESIWRVYMHNDSMTGTIVSEAVPCILANKNAGSSLTLANSVAYVGGEGKTASGGTLRIASLVNAPARAPLSLSAITLPKGASIAISCQPGTANDGMNVICAMSVTHSRSVGK